MDYNDEYIIVLAGGKITNKKFYYTKYNFENFCFLPVGSKLLIKIWEDLLDYLKVDKTKVFFIIDSIKPKEKKLLTYITDSLNLLILDEKTEGAVDTLYKGLTKLINEKKIRLEDRIIITPITTLITKDVFYQKESDMIVYVSKDTYKSKFGLRLSFVDKVGQKLIFYSKHDKVKSGNIFTGILCTLCKYIIGAYNYVSRKDDLVEIPKAFYLTQKNSNISIVEIDFIDFGHEMNFNISRKKLVNSRAFNNFSVDFIRQTFHKVSNDRVKIEQEFEFYESLPDELKHFFPCNPKLEELEIGKFLSMELIPHPTLGEIYLFHKITEDYITGVFQKLYEILTLFKKYKIRVPKDKVLEFYCHKTEYRLNKFSEQILNRDRSLYKTLIENDCITINGKTFYNFSRIKDYIYTILDKNTDGELAITHGDLCFSNILVDLSHKMIKLIDPRGSFIEGVTGIYGDPRYDAAKLLHSSIGKYENILYGLYNLYYDNGKFELSIFEIDKFNTNIFEYYTKSLVKSLGYDLNLIMILVGLLFISMPALHYEDDKRQIAQYLNGIRILNNALEGRYQ